MNELISVSKQQNSRERAESIYQITRERICLMHYPPGSLLKEAELAEEFGLSRTPIRQVIKRLEFEGLVVSQNGVGTMVTSADPKELQDVYQMRLKAAELIGVLNPRHCQPSHVTGLKALLRRASEIKGVEDIEELARINHDLHNLIVTLIGNSSLRSLYDLYYFQTTRVWYQLMPDLWTKELAALRNELKELIDAATRDDVVAIGYIKRNFIARTISLIQHHENPALTSKANTAVLDQ